jgi:signal transduction histidine kinase
MATFNVQARVLDLLGEQQIANAPTAMSELFKNAFDAYATRASLDVYPEADQALVWDDGVGMSERDVYDRWLMVGTSAKRDTEKSNPLGGRQPRPVQGEKGIGRLAISIIGDSLLLVSRRGIVDVGHDEYVALFINWNVVRNDELMLSEIEVPVITFRDLDELDSGIVQDMVHDFRRAVLDPKSAGKWKRPTNAGLKEKLLSQLSEFSVDVDRLRTSPIANRNGTSFYMRDLNKEILQYVRRREREAGDSQPHDELVQLLSNFTNRFEPRSPIASAREGAPLPFAIDVRRFDADPAPPVSVIDESEAFAPEDLRLHDHFACVTFDEHGLYSGEFSRYRKPVSLPPVSEQAPSRRPTPCGPFSLQWWYFQGDPNETLLSKDQYEEIDRRLKRFGGLMVYRDGLRVLPYGRPESDWLMLEERRSRSAARYHFSYRRMFGFISITRHGNPALLDKAGREGLLSNSAYRSLKQQLRDFFSQLALRFFYKNRDFRDAKSDLKSAANELLDTERKRVTQRRKDLLAEARRRMEFIASSEDAPEQLLLKALAEVEDHTDEEELAATIARFNERIQQIEGRGRLAIPKNFSFGNDHVLKQAVHEHSDVVAAFADRIVRVRDQFDAMTRERFPAARMAAVHRQALQKSRRYALSLVGKARTALIHELKSTSDRTLADAQSFCDDRIGRIDASLMQETGASNVDEALAMTSVDPNTVVSAINRQASEAVAAIDELRERLVEHQQGLISGQRDELLAAQTDALESLKAEVDKTLELVQVGLSVEIIDHDLQRLYRGLRAGLKELRQLVRNAPRARSIADDLRANFEHLEERYRQMQPIYRGSYRIKSELTGNRIYSYVQQFLCRPLESVGVSLTATPAFRELVVTEVPAVVLPVFVNLVDNAIYWLREEREREVRFDMVDGVVTVCDTGPGIPETLIKDIFESFFSLKPNGRGLGLYIARTNLERNGHSVWATNALPFKVLRGGCFCIKFHDDVLFNTGERDGAG